MNSILRSSFFWGLLCIGGLFTADSFSSSIVAQDETTTSKEKQVEESTVKKPRKEPRGRVPTYYNAVIDGIQREKIYSIQKEYASKLEKLQSEIDSLKKEMNARIEQTLTPEQKKTS